MTGCIEYACLPAAPLDRIRMTGVVGGRRWLHQLSLDDTPQPARTAFLFQATVRYLFSNPYRRVLQQRSSNLPGWAA